MNPVMPKGFRSFGGINYSSVSTSYWHFLSGFLIVLLICSVFFSVKKRLKVWKDPAKPLPSHPSLGLSSFRWSITLVLSVWLLLQKPQGRWGERHLLQWPLHLQLWESVRSWFPTGHRHPRAGQPPVAPTHPRPDPGQAAKKGPRHHAPAVRAPAEEWSAAHAHS